MRRLLPALAVLALLATACGDLVDVAVQPVEAVPVDTPEQSLVFAADGTRIATIRVAHRVNVEREEIPEVLVDAIVAAEDRRFLDHDGVDVRAIARAALANQRAGRIVQGGSTITQQLIKNRYFPEAEDSLERKADEALLALQLEQTATKDEILTDYLNTVYFGSGAYGIQAAAGTYFGVELAELNLPQAALLAGLVRSPESANPHKAPERAVAERRRVLEAMAEVGTASRADALAAAAVPLGVLPLRASPATRYPHFVELVKRQLLTDPTFGPDETSRVRALHGGGLRIHTTLDPVIQAHAEAAARTFLPGAEHPEVAIAVVDHRSGDLVALVGGRDFAESQFDLASQGARSPGSTFKLFALLTALRDGMELTDRVDSGSVVLPMGARAEPWSVRSGTAGVLPLDEAFARSSNGAFARLSLQLGPARIAQQARALGITAEIGANPSVVLGGVSEGVSALQMATAYGAVANGGLVQPTVSVGRITDADGDEVWEPDRVPWVGVEPLVAWKALQALRLVVEEGTGQLAGLGERPAAGKTGTSQDYRDAWFVGSTPELTAAVWVGHRDAERPMLAVNGVPRVEGGTFPARIWRHLMTAALADAPVRGFRYPDHLAKTVEIDPESGGLATPWCPLVVELTGLPHELPTDPCRLHGPPEPSPAPSPERPTGTLVGGPGADDPGTEDGGGAPPGGEPVPAPTPEPTPEPAAEATPEPTPEPTATDEDGPSSFGPWPMPDRPSP